MSWNYRVIKRTFKKLSQEELFFYYIHEAYYDKENRVNSISLNPLEPHGDTVEDLKKDLELMLEAFNKPILDFKTAIDPEAISFYDQNLKEELE